MRCPGCGMLVDQERLNGVHEFEIIIHTIGSRGRGKIYNIYRKPDNIEGNAFLRFKMGLAAKFREIADRMERDLKDEFVSAEYVDENEDGGDEEWRLESEVEVVPVPQVLLREVMEAESVEVQESETVLKAEAELKETET